MSRPRDAVCRICFEGDGDLSRPCACRGSAAYVHEACLIKWCEFRNNNGICDVCNQRYVGTTAASLALNRLNQIKYLGEEHPEMLKAASNLASALDQTGQHEQAMDILRKTLTRLRRKLGDEHPLSLCVAGTLAQSMCNGGLFGEAALMGWRTLISLRRVKGDADPSTLTVTNNLALALCHLGQHEEAYGLHLMVYEKRECLFGSDHADTILSAINLAGVTRLLGRHEESARLYENALVAQRQVLGDEHPQTLLTASNLAVVLNDLGRVDEALLCQEKTVAAQCRTLGEVHPKTREARSFFRHLEDVRRRSRLKRLEIASTEPVLDFLLDLGICLAQALTYLPKFVDNGFDSMSAVRLMKECHLADMAVQVEHRRLILASLEGSRQHFEGFF